MIVKRLSLVFVLSMLLLAAIGAPLLAAQGSEPVVYLRYDVDIEVQADGTMHVREEQEILFNESFRTAFAEIPLNYVTEIRDVQVSAAGEAFRQVSGAPAEAGTYSVSYEQQAVFVEWMYEQTTPGESRTFVLEYDVIGGLWIYDDGDILEWRAVPADRSGVPVRSSTVTVTLPEGAGASTLEAHAFGPPFDVETDDRQATFVAESEIADGTAFQVMVGFPHGLVEQAVQAWQRAEDSAELVYRLRAVEVELDITESGVIDIVERQTVAVEEGVLYGGQRTIPLAYVDGFANFSLSEGQEPYAMLTQFDPDCESCAWVEERTDPRRWVSVNRGMGSVIVDEDAAGRIQIGWTAPPLVRGEETTFVLRYTAFGVIQVGEEAQVLSWTAVSGFDVPVDEARVLVDLPATVTPQNIDVEGGAAQTLDDGRLLITHEGSLTSGEAWQVRLTLPPGVTAGAKPVWQQEMESAVAEADAIQERFRQEEIQRARLQLAFGVAGLMLLIGGLSAVGIIWYLWGRDRESGVAPDYLSEPPSDLPPGIVAYLLDEKPTPKGVLASLFHLATLGLLRIDLSDPIKVARNWDDDLVEGQEIETEAGDTVLIPNHMVTLFNGLRPHLSTELTPLSQVARHLPEIIPHVYVEMGEEATEFFARLPEDARRRWLVYGQWIVLGGVGLALAALFVYFSNLRLIAAAPALALVIVGFALVVVSRWMPQRSDVGAEEAARWRAFERYLRQLQQYGDEQAAQRILDRDFAYAVALDVEDVVLAQAAQMDAALPSWTRPVIIAQPQHRTDPSPFPGPLRRRPAGAARLPERTSTKSQPAERVAEQAPSLQGLADTLAARLEQANDTLTNTLRLAVGDVTDTPFQLVWRGASGASKVAAKTSLEVMEAILDEAASGGGSGGYRGSSGGHRSSRGSWGSSRSSGFSGRSSGSRRSGGGGSRGFGR